MIRWGDIISRITHSYPVSTTLCCTAWYCFILFYITSHNLISCHTLSHHITDSYRNIFSESFDTWLCLCSRIQCYNCCGIVQCSSQWSYIHSLKQTPITWRRCEINVLHHTDTGWGWDSSWLDCQVERVSQHWQLFEVFENKQWPRHHQRGRLCCFRFITHSNTYYSSSAPHWIRYSEAPNSTLKQNTLPLDSTLILPYLRINQQMNKLLSLIVVLIRLVLALNLHLLCFLLRLHISLFYPLSPLPYFLSFLSPFLFLFLFYFLCLSVCKS